MRKRILALGAVFLILSVLTAAYFTGLWVPNNPNITKYPIRGVDVSGHQGYVDWKAVGASGIRFTYLKATEGGDFQDAKFTENLRAAHQAGLACGAYHFFSLKTPGDVQAENFIKTVPKELIALPPAIDLEFWGNSSVRPSPEAFQKELSVYIDAIRKAYNREPVIYTSDDFSKTYLKDFPIKRLWVRDVLFSPDLDGTDSWVLWQFTERARVPGIAGFVDMDVFNGSNREFYAFLTTRSKDSP